MVADFAMANGGRGNPPTLYQEYVGHDNNRDAYMLNMIESRVMEHTWRDWEPNIIHVFHQEERPNYDLEGLWADAPQRAVAPGPAPEALPS